MRPAIRQARSSFCIARARFSVCLVVLTDRGRSSAIAPKDRSLSWASVRECPLSAAALGVSLERSGKVIEVLRFLALACVLVLVGGCGGSAGWKAKGRFKMREPFPNLGSCGLASAPD